MALVSSADIIRKMVMHKQIIVAFNVFNNESIDAVILAAEEANRPVILELNETDLNHFGIEEIAALVRVKAKRAKTDVILHLDHGMSLEIVARCIRAGFTSVMIDPSMTEESKRIPLVKEVVNFSHAIGVTVESMVGQLKLALDVDGEGGTFEERTDPTEASIFSKATGIDTLAVSVGTEHGSFIIGKKVEVDISQLAQIAAKVDIPLVIHGGSGVSDEQLCELRKYHVGKMNIGSAIRVAYRKTIKTALQEELLDIQEANDRARHAMYEVALHKIKMLSC
jgi:tagatose 1,6-diphosphate aldolase GatY/KbaY